MGIPSQGVVALWVFLSFAVERIVEVVLKVLPSIDKRKLLGVEVSIILSFVFSLITAIGASINFFEVFEIHFRWPFVGYVFSALVMTGGSNLLHDIVEWGRAGKELARVRLRNAVYTDLLPRKDCADAD
ncbi:MAG: hypothetical protein ACOX3V_00930 [Bacillota bacterium]|jgi:hypothetical protein